MVGVHVGVFWLAEQGLATKGVLLVMLPLLIFFVVTFLDDYRKVKGGNMKRKTLGKVFIATTHKTIKVLSGGMAGSALLAKTHQYCIYSDKW